MRKVPPASPDLQPANEINLHAFADEAARLDELDAVLVTSVALTGWIPAWSRCF